MKYFLFSISFIFLQVSFGQTFKSLIVNNSLTGWKQINGTAPYKVVNGEIIGTTVVNSQFIFSDRKNVW